MSRDDSAKAKPIRADVDAPLPDPRRFMIASIAAIVILAFSVIAAALYAVQVLDEVAIAGEKERAAIALAAVGTGPEAARQLANEYVLDGARFASAAGVGQAEVSIGVPGEAEKVLAWTPRRIGTAMLFHLAPLRIAASGVFLFGVIVVLRRLYRMTWELERRRREAHQMALQDGLTGLANRLAFDQWLSRSAGTEVGLLYLDLDGFKQINDTLGHGAGDEVLRLVAGRIARLAGPQDLIARVGGDEFAFVRPGPIGRADLAELAADLGAALGEPLRLGTSELNVAASVGIAMGAAGDPELIAQADVALYRAKALPGHTFVFAEAA